MNQENKAYYLYGIIKDEPLEGIVKIPFNGIAGVVSSISLDEFGEVPLMQNLESLDWVRDKVFKHERVIEDVMKRTTIIPMKFCTIFKSEEKIIDLLKEKYSYFMELLEKYRDKSEWGVKIYCKKEEFQMAKTSTGRDYLLAKKVQEEKLQKDERYINAIVEEIYKKIRQLAEEAKVNRPTPKELLPDKNKEQVLNLSILVPDDNANKLVALVDNLARQYSLILELVGPLPVYSFIGGEKDE